MSLDAALSNAQKNIPECVAIGFVDIKTGMLLSVKTVDSHPREVLDLVAAATGEIFQGSNVSAIEQMFKKIRGAKDDGHHYFQEIIVLSDNLIHAFLRCKRNEDMVLVAVCRVSANLGLVLAKTRLSLAGVEAAALSRAASTGRMAEIFSPVGCVADVLLVLDELPAMATGEVVCTSAEGVRVGTVFVEKGRVCWAVAPGLARRLVDLLLAGRVSGGRGVIEEAFRTCRAEGKPLGEHLVASGIVSESDLRAALLRHSAESLVASCSARSWACFTPRGARGYSPWFTFDTPTLLVEAGSVLAPSATPSARAVLSSALVDHGWAAAFARTGGAPTALALAGQYPTAASQVTSLGKWAASVVDMASAAAGAASFVAASLPNGDTAAGWMEADVLVAAVVPAKWTGPLVARALRGRQAAAPRRSRSTS